MGADRLNLHAPAALGAVVAGLAVAYVGHGSLPVLLAAFAMPALVVLGDHRPEVVLALFLVSGQFTLAGMVELDVGVLLGVALGAATVMCVYKNGLPRIPMNVVILIAVAIFVLLGVTYSLLPAYGVAKGLRFVVLGVLAMIASVVIVRDESSLRRFMWWLWLVAAGVALVAVAASVAGGFTGRLTSFGGGPITLGRLSGVGLACAVVVFAERGRWRYLAAVSVPVLALGLLGSGSRGPMLSALVASGVLVIGMAARRGASPARLVGLTAAMAAVVALVWRQLPETVLSRYALLTSSSPGASIAVRSELIRAALRVSVRYPLTGAGTGSFGVAAQASPFLYPHNMIAEVLAENGFVVGCLLVSGLAIGLARAVRTAWHERSILSWAVVFVVVFMMSNAMFSGDLNDNQILLAFMAMGATGWTGWTETHPPHVAESMRGGGLD